MRFLSLSEFLKTSFLGTQYCKLRFLPFSNFAHGVPTGLYDGIDSNTNDGKDSNTKHSGASPCANSLHCG